MKPSHLILLLVLNCGWSAVPTLVTRLEGQLTAIEFVFLRYALALAALVILWPWLPGRLPRGGDFWRCIGMGIAVFNIGHVLQILGFQLSHASDASILLAIDPLVSSMGAAIFLHEPISRRRWLGFALAIAGVVAMSVWRRVAPLPGLLANLLIVLSFVTEAVWSIAGKPLIRRWGIPKVTALSLAAGTLANAVLLAPSPLGHWQAYQHLSVEGWSSLAVLGPVLTAFGYSAWYLVIREVPVNLAAMTIYLQPIVGTALAISLTGEALHAGHVLGASLVLAGLIVGLSCATLDDVPAIPEK